MAFAQNPLPLWPEPGPKRRHFVLGATQANLVLAFLSLMIFGLAVVVTEASLSAANIGFPADASLAPLHRYSEVYGWEPRIGRSLVDGRIVTTINAAGYRGPLLPSRKTGAQRLVLLGDSIGFGADVDDDQTFLQVFHRRRGDVEVANLAVQGYDPGQEVLKLEREGLALRPDIVVLALCLSNDFADVALPMFLYDGTHPKPYFRLEGDRLVEYDQHLKLSTRQRVALWLGEHSRIYGLLTSGRGRTDALDQNWSRRRKQALKDKAGVIELTSRLVGRMNEDSRRAGAAFVVLAFPDRKTFKGDYSWLNALMGTRSMRGIAVVNMAERYRSRSVHFSDVAFDDIGHLSAEGHFVTAEILEDVLVDAGLVAPGRSPAEALSRP